MRPRYLGRVEAGTALRTAALWRQLCAVCVSQTHLNSTPDPHTPYRTQAGRAEGQAAIAATDRQDFESESATTTMTRPFVRGAPAVDMGARGAGAQGPPVARTARAASFLSDGAGAGVGCTIKRKAQSAAKQRPRISFPLCVCCCFSRLASLDDDDALFPRRRLPAWFLNGSICEFEGLQANQKPRNSANSAAGSIVIDRHWSPVDRGSTQAFKLPFRVGAGADHPRNTFMAWGCSYPGGRAIWHRVQASSRS